MTEETAPHAELTKPEIEEIQQTASRILPEVSAGDVEFLGDGWDFWAFGAGDHVLRIPKRAVYLGHFVDDSALLAELAPRLPLPVPVLESRHEGGPNGLPFSVYRKVPGVMLLDLKRPAAPGFGRSLGRFLRALHSFPAERAVELGLKVFDPAALRQAQVERYELWVRRLFPLLACEARTYVQQRAEVYLNDSKSFDFRPVLIHGDIDSRNLLADPETGALSGVIDFGDGNVGDPAADVAWALARGFAELGIGGEVPDLLREVGLRDEDVRPRCEYNIFAWYCHDIMHGLDIGDDAIVEDGIRALNAAVPRSIRCD